MKKPIVSKLRTMTFQELLCFAEVCRSGGITSAAATLAMSKSAVSKQITRLEEHLGLQLLERSSRRVQLTRAGEHILPRIDSLLAETQRLIEQAKEEQTLPEGLVRIAATPEFGSVVACALFPKAAQMFPRVQLVMSPTYAFEDLQDPAFDLGIRIGHVDDERLVARPVGSFRRILVASADYLTKHPIRSVADLVRANCLCFSDRKARSTWTFVPEHHVGASETDEQHVEVSGSFAVRSFTSIVQLAAAGAGIGYVPDFTAAEALKARKLRRCLPELCSRPARVHLVYRVGASRVRRVKVILDLVSELIPGLLA